MSLFQRTIIWLLCSVFKWPNFYYCWHFSWHCLIITPFYRPVCLIWKFNDNLYLNFFQPIFYSYIVLFVKLSCKYSVVLIELIFLFAGKSQSFVVVLIVFGLIGFPAVSRNSLKTFHISVGRRPGEGWAVQWGVTVWNIWWVWGFADLTIHVRWKYKNAMCVTNM